MTEEASDATSSCTEETTNNASEPLIAVMFERGNKACSWRRSLTPSRVSGFPWLEILVLLVLSRFDPLAMRGNAYGRHPPRHACSSALAEDSSCSLAGDEASFASFYLGLRGKILYSLILCSSFEQSPRIASFSPF